MTNRLANATSPYLLQHAHNPVDWYEWSPEALERAQREDKPILLSIGYAACHWCHVMERESFEDAETASLMNEHFVSIKVDREERPDLDSIYMSAVQAMTGHGGWPMTMFLTPEGVPLYGGTYFPPDDRHGLPSFRRVLLAVSVAWRTQRSDLLAQGQKLLDHIGDDRFGTSETLSAETLRVAFDGMAAAFDPEEAGFGRAPKFPQPMNLEFLLRGTRLDFEGAQTMLRQTLKAMALGGIHDQLGGGFHRYSVDAAWLVPHFEKMLYDNGALLRLYARAAIALPDDFASVAIATGEYLLREMRSPAGGFFSSQDADSEGVEGKFYVWSLEELRLAAGTDADAAAAFYGATETGNWESTNILTARELPVPEEVEPARERLLAARENRVHPATDDKVIAAWNGIAISGLAEAGRLLNRPDFVDAARAAADFVLAEMRDGNGRLMRSWRDGRTSGMAYLDDHALMADALLDLYETTFEERYFVEASALAGRMIELFADERGGFYDTGSDQPALVLRPKDVVDNAVPSGNSVAAGVLLRLAALTGDAALEERAAATLRLVHEPMSRAPLGFGHLLCALDAYLNGTKEIALAGDAAAPQLRTLAHTAWRRVALPKAIAAGSADRVPLLRGREPLDGQPTAYVCERFVCKRPVTDPADLAELLDVQERNPRTPN